MNSRENTERRRANVTQNRAPRRNEPVRSPVQDGHGDLRRAGSRARASKGPGPFRRFLKTPKGTVLFVLLGLMLIGAAHASDRAGIWNIIVAMVTASVIDLLVNVARRNKRVFPDGGMITGLIIGLVLSGAVHFEVAALTSAIATASKHLLKIGRKPIFNPAAFALLFTLLVFHTGQSWWGDLADLPVFVLPVLIVAGYFITARVNKYPQVLTYLGTYFLLLTLAASLHWGNAAFTPGDAMRVPLVNAALFMAFFMLTDPPTSPGKYAEQVTFSVLAAVVSVAVYLVVGGLSYLLIGLLTANGWRALVAWRFARANARRKEEEKEKERVPVTVTRDEYYV